MADKELLKQALERMDRARAILTNDNPRLECNWGMLDTSDLRAAIAQPKQTAPPESALQSLARRCLWIAYCWNDHNFNEAYTYARKTAQELGINDFDEANEWLVAQPEQVMQDEPVAWLVYAGVMNMHPVYPAYKTRELAEHAASEIKSVTEIKPLYTTPQPATSADQSIGLSVC